MDGLFFNNWIIALWTVEPGSVSVRSERQASLAAGLITGESFLGGSSMIAGLIALGETRKLIPLIWQPDSLR